MTDLNEELAKDTERLKASLKSDDLRVKEYTETFWMKYGAWVTLGLGLLIGVLVGVLL